jgi:uncharacterized membrane protein YhaH (DUF805 family)
MSYFLSFAGRINRAKLWLFMLITLAVEIAIFVLAEIGLDGMNFFSALQSQITDIRPGQQLNLAALPLPVVVGPTGWIAVAAILALIVFWIYAKLALTVKRLHDRNKSAAWLLVFWGLPWILGIVIDFGCPGLIGDKRVSQSLLLVGCAISIWAFVELYCLRGTDGGNRFGPNPLS